MSGPQRLQLAVAAVLLVGVWYLEYFHPGTSLAVMGSALVLMLALVLAARSGSLWGLALTTLFGAAGLVVPGAAAVKTYPAFMSLPWPTLAAFLTAAGAFLAARLDRRITLDQLRAAYSNAPAPLVLANAAGAIQFANAPFAELIGL